MVSSSLIKIRINLKPNPIGMFDGIGERPKPETLYFSLSVKPPKYPLDWKQPFSSVRKMITQFTNSQIRKSFILILPECQSKKK